MDGWIDRKIDIDLQYPTISICVLPLFTMDPALLSGSASSMPMDKPAPLYVWVFALGDSSLTRRPTLTITLT